MQTKFNMKSSFYVFKAYQSTNVQITGIFIMRSTHFIFPYHPILLPRAKHFPHRQLVLCRAFMECDEIIFSCLFLQETTFENLP